MKNERNGSGGAPPARRLPKAQRRQQLLDAALELIRDEGADRLSLGRVAARAGVSKPVAYDHFGTRSDLLIELYRSIDIQRVNAFQNAMTERVRTLEETARALAEAYIHCAADTAGEFHAIGAALAGDECMAAVFQELLDNCVQMFVAVLRPHSGFAPAELKRRCIGWVGAGEALAGATLRGRCSTKLAVGTFAGMILGGMRQAEA